MNHSIKEMISENVNVCSNPSELKITDIRVANINGAYALMLKSGRIVEKSNAFFIKNESKALE